MSRVGSTPDAADRFLGSTLIVSGTPLSAFGRAIIVVSLVLMSTGCAAVAAGETKPTPTESESTPSATPSTPTATPSSAQVGLPKYIGFDDGGQLDPLASVGWHLAFGGDDAIWSPNPDAPEGETSFVNAEGTCTAYYDQAVFETAAADDRSASDELLAEVSGATAGEVIMYATDEYFVRTSVSASGASDGQVANRIILAENESERWLAAVRVFTNLDYATSQMSNAYALQIMCDPSVDPSTQLRSLDELGKIAVDQ